MRALVLLLALGAALSLLWFVLRGSPPAATGAGAIAPAAPVAEGRTARPGALPESAPEPPEEAPVESRSVARPVEVKDFRGYLVRGRLLRSDGRVPLSCQVRVWEWEDPQFFVEDYEPFRFESEPLTDGRFEVLVDRQGEFRVWGSATGECSSDVVSVKLNPRVPETEVVLVLPTARRIKGRVVDYLGEPAAGVYLVAFVDVERYGGNLPEGLTSVEAWGRPETRSQNDGTFELFPTDSRARGYVLYAQAARHGRIVMRDAAGGYRLMELARHVEVPQVLAGSEGVVVTLGEQLDTLAQVDLRVTTEGGSGPPPVVQYELRHLGPNGSVFVRRPGAAKPDVRGLVPIADLLPGARYELAIRAPYLHEELRSEPFVAHLGIQEVHVVLPFSVEVEIEVKDAEGEAARNVTLQVFTPAEPGGRRTVHFSRSGQSSWPATFPLLPGTYQVAAGDPFGYRATGELVVEQQPVRLVLELSR